MYNNFVAGKKMYMQNNLYGLVVCGGESFRMGCDKSLLIYHQKPQREHVYEILKSICSEVFISCNAEQSAGMDNNLPAIPDMQIYKNTGPMAALLTAFSFYPDNDFIICGCDYPFISEIVLFEFLTSLKKDRAASAFYNSEEDLYEPLLAFYTSECGSLLKSQFREKNYSLQYFLRSVEAEKYYPADLNLLKSVDTPEDYVNASALIKEQLMNCKK